MINVMEVVFFLVISKDPSELMSKVIHKTAIILKRIVQVSYDGTRH